MDRLRWLTGGESHGAALTGILEGCPAGLPVAGAAVDHELGRRQHGYGRGERMSIEQDRVVITGGVRYGLTTGAPIVLTIPNRDAAHWGRTLAVDALAEDEQAAEPITVPRPGHADLGGALLYDLHDIRPVIERASARETAARVAMGAVAKSLLGALGCRVASHVVAVGGVHSEAELTLADVERVEADPMRCADPTAGARMRAEVDDAMARGDTLGGVIEVLAVGYPIGVGSYVQGDRRLQSVLAEAVFTVPAIKGLEFGLGFRAAALRGSQVHDEIVRAPAAVPYARLGNNAGGIEGGISTGAPIVLRAAMKPISTLRTPLRSVDMQSGEAVESRFERSDTCAVPAAGIVLEAVVALALAGALLERFGGATVDDVRGAVQAYRARLAGR
jgi:chorismate synthase